MILQDPGKIPGRKIQNVKRWNIIWLNSIVQYDESVNGWNGTRWWKCHLTLAKTPSRVIQYDDLVFLQFFICD